ncbi:MAG: hypothetical protein E6600_04640 [Anaerocolumna aminovalerica]|uniref:hypothetical protein n=1 Tax=Anaerocolumna aminovalerica TaxID=1527 RepID=UPI002909FAFE|nr:hypothetical protein [Anaerocolumna aminovalerica]MDU6263770.1 hypothetical protein [Anaerocolumna aminovalerica]
MAKREYRKRLENELMNVKESIIDDLESDVYEIIKFAEGIDTADAEAMTDGIETIIADLNGLADKLY